MNLAHKNYNLVSLLFNRSPKLLIFSMIAGLLAGIGYSLIIPFLFTGMEIQSGNNVIKHSFLASIISHNFVTFYFFLCILILALRCFSLIVVTIITKDIMADLRISLCHKIHVARVKEVENIGFPKLINILTQDIQFVGFAASGIPILFIEVISIMGLLGYLCYLDWKIFVFMLLALAISTIVLRIPLALAEKYMAKARRMLDQLQQGIKGLVFGSYELKLNQEKALAFIREEIETPERNSARESKIADSLMMCAGNLASIISFMVIGFLAFVLPKLISVDNDHTLSIVLVMLYVISPISIIFSVIPNLSRGNIAIQYILGLYKLDEENAKIETEISDWNEIRLKNISYEYNGSSNDSYESFHLQPINLNFHKGEITFIVGGNGSGKSTLGKLISLHYSPKEGNIFFGDTRIDSSTITSARNSISIIFSNYHLFEKLYQPINQRQLEKINFWLKMFALSNKTQFINGQFTTTNLSDGQRRRLALLVAFLENRDIYIFDEWAADQDPLFKNIFYTQIIHELKAANKLVIVITHDDRYFNEADKIIFMEDGKVNSIEHKSL